MKTLVTSQTEIGNHEQRQFESPDDLNKENTGDYKENYDEEGFKNEHIFEKENGQSIIEHIHQSREELHKAGTKEDKGAVDFDNIGQSDQEQSQENFADQEIESDTIHSSTTHVTNESMNEDIHISDESRGQHSDENEYARSDDSTFVLVDTQGKCVHANLNNSTVDTSSKNLTTEQSLNGSELTNNVSKDEMKTLVTSQTEIGNHEQRQFESPDDLNKENTGDYKENYDEEGFKNEHIFEKENGQSIIEHIHQSREELHKAGTKEDKGAVDFDNIGQSDQEQSQENFADQEIESDTIHSSTTHVTNESMNEDIHISDESRGQHSDENEYARSDDSTFVLVDTQGKCANENLNNSAVDTSPKNLTTEQTLNGSELTDNVSKDEMNTLVTSHTEIGNHEQRQFESPDDLNKENTGDYKENDDEEGFKNEHIFEKENGQSIIEHIHQTREQLHKAGTKEDKGAVDFDNSGQGDQEQRQEYFADQEIESDTIHSSVTHVTNERMNEDIHISDESRGQHSHENEYARSDDSKFVIVDTQGKCANENLNNSAVDTSSKNLTTEQALNGSELTDNVSKDEMNTLAKSHTEIGNHEQIQFESPEDLNKENTGYFKENNDDGGFKNEKENGETVNVQIQQSVEEAKESFHQELKTLQQQLESVTQEKIDLSECKDQLEQELKCEKQELDVWKERANKLESEKEEQEFEKVTEKLKGWKEKKAVMLENQEDVFTANWKESKGQTQQKLTSFEVELTSSRQEKEQVVEDKNQLEEQLLQVNDELEGWKQNNARLESQLAQSQQSMEETKNYFQQNLAILQQQLESAKEENFNLSEGKNQVERELETVTGELDKSREKANELQNQNEEIQQFLEETKYSLHQELLSFQNQLDSVKQENRNIQDEKHHLVQEQQLLTDQLEECKTKLAQLENRKEQLNISTKAIEDTIKQEYSSIQRHLESNGSEGQDYKRLSDEKNQLEEQLMHVNSELDKMKEKVVELENVKGEKDQLEQELDRMRKIAAQLESMKEEIERYRAQHQQIIDQLRNTQQQLEQSYQECEGLSADLARKGEKEENYQYIETMFVKLGREKESHLREIQELKNKVDLVEEFLSSMKEEKQTKDETIKQLKADVQIKEENSNQIKRQYEADLEQFQTMGQSRDSEIENQKREIARITSQKQQLEENIFKIRTELEKKHSELQREQLEHIHSKNTLTQYVEAIKKMNSQVQSKDKEIEIMQEEVNKVRIESREFQLKYRDLPQKEANFKVIENSNRYLIDENAQLQERIRSFGPFESTLHYLREENSRLSWEGQRYQERISFMEQKYRDQTCNIQQLTEEVQVFRGHRIELKRQLHQKTDEAEAVSRRLKDTLEKKENLERELHGKITKCIIYLSSFYAC
ncbi:unnamed protein product [Mytilus coruscus]|uniref:Uncharacterized protein n=1 Tax=Mytilus coruscus TaxID=42192 RepID=A0A6J8D051_MYTCO|nr:unnamed protein product [Mytilus coruscus]